MAAEDYNRWVQVYHDRAVAYALALYDYARTSEGFLEKAVVQRCVDEIDGAIAEADQSLSRIEGQIEVPDSGQQMEITDIRTDYGIANDHVAKLKLALEAPPIDRNRVETEARAISDVMLKAAREVERLRVFKAVRKPPDFPLAEVR
jgi:hypothetical protein